MRSPLDILYNLHWVVPGKAARSAQPYLGFYGALLKRHGFKSLINLRGENPQHGWWRRENALAARSGVAHFNISLSSRRPPSRAELVQLFEAFEAAQTPVLLKCSGGQDRTSLASALYLLFRGAPLGEALEQFAPWPYLHRPKPYQGWLKYFPAYAVDAANGKSLAQWAREDYEPAKFGTWLDERGLADSYRGLP